MKEDVHAAIKNIDKGIFPKAFCKILPDILGGDPEYCNIMHADGAGTKSSLAYIYWKETGDLGVWRGIAQDAIVMNTDDLLCVGAVDNILVSSTIGRNKMLIPGEVISAIINGTDQLLAEMRNMGIGIYATGGETADVGDLVRTIIVDSTVTCRMKRSDVIDNANIRPGDVIVGLSSSGQATYEKQYNGGMGSNGLTSARHDVFAKYLAEKYPESYDKAVPEELVYSGSYRLTDAAYAYLRADNPPGARRASPCDTWNGALHRRRANQSAQFRGRRLLRCQGQHVPRAPVVPCHKGRKRNGLGGDVQGVQHGTSFRSLRFSRKREPRYRHQQEFRRGRAGSRSHRKRRAFADHKERIRRIQVLIHYSLQSDSKHGGK